MNFITNNTDWLLWRDNTNLSPTTRMGIKEFMFSTTDLKGDSEFLIETGNHEMKDEKKTDIDKGKYVVYGNNETAHGNCTAKLVIRAYLLQNNRFAITKNLRF